MISNILVALNTQEPYAHIFEQALYLAKVTGAKLKLLSILSTIYDYTMSVGYYPGTMGHTTTASDTFWGAYQAERIKQKESVLKTLSELTVIIQASGDPGVGICDHARAEQVDLIVVGSHGRRGIDELLVGSVSSYVMHRAACSVMVVHDQALTETMAESKAAVA